MRPQKADFLLFPGRILSEQQSLPVTRAMNNVQHLDRAAGHAIEDQISFVRSSPDSEFSVSWDDSESLRHRCEVFATIDEFAARSGLSRPM
jgi:hypothetical protein